MIEALRRRARNAGLPDRMPARSGPLARARGGRNRRGTACAGRENGGNNSETEKAAMKQARNAERTLRTRRRAGAFCGPEPEFQAGII